MFDIVLYSNSSPNNYLNKNITEVTTISGVLKEDTSIINPIFRIEYTSIPLNVNYIYVQTFGRYYYINDIISVNNNLIELQCAVDVLMSYKTDLANCKGIVRKSGTYTAFNVMLDDGSLRTYSDPYIRTIEFSSGFNNTEFVLAVAGGSSG